MKRIIPSIFTFLFLALSLQAQRAAQATEADLVVQFVEGIDVEVFLKQENLTKEFGLRPKEALAPRFGYYLLQLDNFQKLAPALQALNKSSKVIFAQQNKKVQFRSTEPDDPMWPQQWGLQRIGVPDVWDVTTGGQTANKDEIVVAVLDRGFDITHEDWQGNLWENPGELNGVLGDDDDNDGLTDNTYGWNYFNDSSFLNGVDHGSWVTGVLGAQGNNGIGITGVNWDVKMMLLRIELISDVVKAFMFVLQERELYNDTNGQDGSFIVATNGSFGVDGQFCNDFQAWSALYDPLGEAGVLSVAATANEDWDVEIEGDMPGTCPSEYLITVTAVNNEDRKVSNASYGAESIDLGAPTFVPTTGPGSDYRENFNGTSAACPHVAGSIALLYSLPCTEIADLAKSDPAAAARLMRDAILENTEPLSDLQGITTTGGLLDVYESMKYLHSYCISRVEDREAGDFKPKYIEEKKIVYLSPNPTSKMLNITYSNDGFGEFSIRIFNAIGQEMEVQKPTANKAFFAQTIEVNVSDWSAGTYIVSVAGAEKTTSMRFVKID